MARSAPGYYEAFRDKMCPPNLANCLKEEKSDLAVHGRGCAALARLDSAGGKAGHAGGRGKTQSAKSSALKAGESKAVVVLLAGVHG